ncbi:oxygenase MpaB family protein [Zhongshania arctica]|uniref:Oxygenase MpaB family protein n=1 Tax=Zhongshania arctica TaxID=3238302 RepID=A0ABV3TYP4_9GAMM
MANSSSATQQKDANPAPVKKLARLNFNSHLNDELVEQTFGTEILREARARLETTEFQEMLNRLFQTGDVTSDTLAKKMRDPKVKSDYQTAISKGLDAVDEPCEELINFMNHAVNIPSFFDRELIEVGAEVFLTRFNPLTFFAFGWPCAGLQGASVGIAAAAWMTNQPPEAMSLMDNIKRDAAYPRLVVRFLETFRWFTEVAQPGAGQLYSNAFEANCRVRMIHSHVRNSVKVDQANWKFTPPLGWNTDELGTPLSAAEGSIVVTTLATAIMLAKRKLSMQVSQREMDGLFQFTSYLNYMQGVPEELLFDNAHDTSVYFAAYLMSMDPNCYKDAVDATYYGIQNLHLEKSLFPDSKVTQILMSGLLQASWQEIYGNRHQEFYKTQKPALWAKTLFRSVKIGAKGVNMASKYSPFLKRKLNDSGLALWNDLFPNAEKKIKQHYKSVTNGTELA